MVKRLTCVVAVLNTYIAELNDAPKVHPRAYMLSLDPIGMFEQGLLDRRIVRIQQLDDPGSG